MFVAKDIVNPIIHIVKTSDNLDSVLKFFSKYNIDQFPVCEAKEFTKIIGFITRQQVLEIYNRESLKNNVTEGLVKEFQILEKFNSIKYQKAFR